MDFTNAVSSDVQSYVQQKSHAALPFQNRNRSCNNPPPSNGGSYCIGISDEQEDCNQNSCAEYFGNKELGGALQ